MCQVWQQHLGQLAANASKGMAYDPNMAPVTASWFDRHAKHLAAIGLRADASQACLHDQVKIGLTGAEPPALSHLRRSR